MRTASKRDGHGTEAKIPLNAPSINTLEVALGPIVKSTFAEDMSLVIITAEYLEHLEMYKYNADFAIGLENLGDGYKY